MNILYIATSFPEPGKGATIYTDLAEALHDEGHNITVAVAEQARNKTRTSLNRERGFEVLRVVTGNYYDVGLLEKGITTMKIPFLMKKGISKYLINRQFDFILYEAPPVTNAGLVEWARKKYKCPSYLMLKDIFPQNAIDLGMIKKNSLLHYYFKNKEKQLYKSATYIGCMSEANKEYILNHNDEIKPYQVEIFPNTKKISNNFKKESTYIREKYSIPENSTVFLFGGNMGKPQYVELLCEAIYECRHDKDIFFLFVGRGTEKYKIEQTINTHKIVNSKVITNLPRDEYDQIIKESDVGLITLDPRFTIPNYPSRILSYLEFSKPVLAATDEVSDLKKLINDAECGNWVPSDKPELFINKIREMASKPDLDDYGSNGRNYLINNLNLKLSTSLLEKHFK